MKIQASQMDLAAAQASDLLKSLANRHRLLVVCQLIEGERSVGDLAEFLGIRASTVSQHLALLRKDGIVSTRRDGQTIWYSIASPQARGILETLYKIYCGSNAGCTPLGSAKPKTARATKASNKGKRHASKIQHERKAETRSRRV